MLSPATIVLLAVFIDLIGFGIVLPLLPSYAAQFHASDTAIGIMVASFSFMQFIFAPLWGRLSDRIGRRPVLLVGLAGSSLSYLLFAFADGFNALLLSRVVAGAMGATVSVAQAYLADVTPPERRSRAMGMLGAAFGLGFVVGPALGGISSRWGDAAPGLVASSLTAANFLLALWKLPEPALHRHVAQDTAVVHWTRFAEPFVVVALSTVAFTVMYVVFPLQVERALGYSRHQTAYFFVLLGIVSALVQGGVVGRLAPRFGEPALMVSGGWLLLAGLGGLALTLGAPNAGPQVTSLVLGSLIFVALGSGLIGPSASSYVSRTAPDAEQGRALGLLQSVASVSRVIGPALAGGLTHHFGARVAFLVAAGAAGIAGLVPLWGGRRSRMPQAK